LVGKVKIMSREMKDSGIEWIGEIPTKWNIVKLKTICDIYTGNSISDDLKNSYTDSNEAYPYISTKDLDAILKNINYENGLYVKKDDNSFKIAKKHSILLCIEGGSAGKKVAFTNQHVAFVNKLCCLKSEKYNTKFVYYYLNSPAFIKQFNLFLSGIIGGVSIGILKQLTCTLPSLQEQQKIVDYLDEKVSKIDNIINQTTISIEEYKEYKQSMITETVTKGLNTDVEMKDGGIEHIGFIPIDWKVAKLKYLLGERNIKSTTGTEEPLSMSQKYGLIKTKDMDMIPNMASSFVGNKYVEINDLVFNKLKAHLGVFGVSSYEGLVSPDYAVYFSKGNVNVKFLEFLFKTRIYINEFKKYSRGVGEGLTRLYTSELFEIKCSVPDLEQQNFIVDFLNKKCSEIDNIISQKQQLLKEIEAYKKSLIYECVTGKREVV
jgi:type I restriction enzyme S subunit